jgi:hypothetical protein
MMILLNPAELLLLFIVASHSCTFNSLLSKISSLLQTTLYISIKNLVEKTLKPNRTQLCYRHNINLSNL